MVLRGSSPEKRLGREGVTGRATNSLRLAARCHSDGPVEAPGHDSPCRSRSARGVPVTSVNLAEVSLSGCRRTRIGRWRASLCRLVGTSGAPLRTLPSTIGAGERPFRRHVAVRHEWRRGGGELSSSESERSAAPGRGGALKQRVKAFRDGIEAKPKLRRTYRVAIAVVGGIVLIAGIIMIPYPGPGWAVVFVGLAILASEFLWAHRVLTYARKKYDAWTDWLGRRSLVVRLAVLAATGLVVLATLWLLNVMYPVARWLGLGSWTWLQSPLFG
jgi:uncharacterized protein (TIGR02611 family)